MIKNSKGARTKLFLFFKFRTYDFEVHRFILFGCNVLLGVEGKLSSYNVIFPCFLTFSFSLVAKVNESGLHWFSLGR